jgi:Zn-dependent protease
MDQEQITSPGRKNRYPSRSPGVFAGIKLFSLAGIPVYARPSLLVVLVMLMALFGLEFFPREYEDAGYGAAVYVLMGAAGAMLFFLSVLIHEVAHCLLARTQLGGRIPIRRITLFFLGGLTEMTEEPRTAGGEFMISFAGPFASIALGALMWSGAVLLGHAGTPVYVTGVLNYIGYLNVFLGVTNLLPGFPLDGGRVLRAIIWHATGDFVKATGVSTIAGRVLGYGAIGAGLVLVVATGGRLFLQAMFLTMFGFFFERSARQVMDFVRTRTALSGLRAFDAMQTDPPCVWEGTILGEVVNRHMMPYNAEALPVLDDAGQLRGVLTARMLEKVPSSEWTAAKAGDLLGHEMLPGFARPEEPLPSVYTLMMRYGLAALPVLDRELRLVGLITFRNLHRMAAFRAHMIR